jgi:hypothetical protein
MMAADVTGRTIAVIGIAAFIAFGVLFGWSAGFPLVVAPLVTGVFVALCLQTPRTSALVAGVAGLLSSAASSAVYAMPGLFETALTSAPRLHSDVPGLLWAAAGDFMARNPLNTLPRPTGTVVLILCGSIGTAAVAWGCAALVRSRTGDTVRLRRLVAAGLVAVQCLSFGYSAVSAARPMLPVAEQEPVAGTYAYDATVYLKAYYGMLKGMDFYSALVDAAAGDTRVMADATTGIRDGKSYGGWLWGPGAMRRPTIFYVWRYLAPGGAAGIIYLAVAFGTAALAVASWGLAPYLSYRAAFVPVLLLPYVLFMTMSWNVFFPDFWAALLTVCGLALVLRRQWLASAAVLLAAAAVRETLGPALAVFAGLLVIAWLRNGRGREWLVRAGAFTGAAASWLASERIHELLGSRFMAVRGLSSLQLLLATAQTRRLGAKLVVPTRYLLFPYDFVFAYAIRRVLGLGVLLLAPLGFWAVLASRKDVRLVVVGYTLFWIGFMATVGATSSYWGQVVMLPSLIGVACLLMSADRMDRRLEMTEPIT